MEKITRYAKLRTSSGAGKEMWRLARARHISLRSPLDNIPRHFMFLTWHENKKKVRLVTRLNHVPKRLWQRSHTPSRSPFCHHTAGRSVSPAPADSDRATTKPHTNRPVNSPKSPRHPPSLHTTVFLREMQHWNYSENTAHHSDWAPTQPFLPPSRTSTTRWASVFPPGTNTAHPSYS